MKPLYGITPEELKLLGRDEKLRLLDLIAEKRRRERERKDHYLPNPGQLPVHQSTHILRAVFSGNGGGKTALGANEAKWALDGYNPVTNTFTKVPCRVVVVLDRPDKVADVWLPELRKWMDVPEDQLRKNGKPYVTQLVRRNGSTLTFMFHEQEPLAFESMEADVFIFDEPPPRHVYVGLRRAGRTRGRKARYLIIGTPLAQAWMRKEIYEPWSRGEAPDTMCFKFGTEVNKANLAEGYIESFAAVLSEKERRIRLHGEFFDLDGLALAHLFNRDVHVVSPVALDEWQSRYPCVVSIDPHPTKPHHAILLGADKTGLLVLKEMSAKLPARPFARKLKEWMKDFRLVDIVCDSLGSAEGTGGEGFKSFIQVLKEEGIQVRPTTFDDKKDADWIERIRDVLLIPENPDSFGRSLPKLRVLETCVGTISDIENVQWTKIRNMDEFKPTLDISNKDFLSCLKYALACNLTPDRKKHKAYVRTQPVAAYGQTSFRVRR